MSSSSRLTLFGKSVGTLGCLFYLFVIVSYITNAVKVFKCDWKSSYKEEVIHVVGVVIPPTCLVTAWYGTEPNMQ